MNSNALAILLVVLNVAAPVSTVQAGSATAETTQLSSRSEPTLDRRIGRADRRRYESVQGAQEWRNPYMLLTDRGFELRSLSQPGPRLVAVEDLRQVLAALPISDWPYGRVAVLQSPSIVPADDTWIAAMERNRRGAIEVLRVLGLDQWGWPV